MICVPGFAEPTRSVSGFVGENVCDADGQVQLPDVGGVIGGVGDRGRRPAIDTSPSDLRLRVT